MSVCSAKNSLPLLPCITLNEIIYWNFAKYFKNSNKCLANIYYNKAINICKAINESTISVLELAIEADKLSISKNINEDKASLIQKYNNIMEKAEFEDIHDFLNRLKDEFEYIELTDDMIGIKNACKIISSEIKV